MGTKRNPRGGEPQPITRRQQVEALRTLKSQEIAATLADKIQEAVTQEVERQLKSIKDTMLSTIDRVCDLESACYEDGETPD